MNKKLVVIVSIVFLLLPVLQFFGFTRAGSIDNKVSATSSTVGHTHYPWPMFRHNPSHTGYTLSPGPTTNDTLWVYETPYDIWGPSPVVANDMLYIGGGFGPILYALNASTGESIWNYTTGFDIFSSPAVVDGIVYIGSNDNNVYALNASTGAKIWNYTTGYWVASSPAVVDGVVYVGSYDFNMYALNASTGAFIWSYPTGGAVSSSPAVAGGIVYVGTGIPANKTYALNATTGAKIWSYKAGNDVWGSPAVVDGVVYTSSRDGKIYAIGYNPFPVASFTYWPESPLVNETVTFNATASDDPDGTIVSYDWDFGDGNIGSGMIVTHNYTNFGIYTVNLTVTDNDGLTDTKLKTVKVGGFPIAKFTYSPEVPCVDETVTFNATASYDRNGYIVSYDWDFGDDTVTTTTDPITTHKYKAVGTYTVNLTVTDNETLTDSTTRSITIVKSDSSISISVSPTTIEVDENTTISGSIDPVRVGVTVTIHYRLTDGTWDTLENVPTDSTGKYSYTWTPEETGTYELKASWPGDANTNGAESSTKTVTVEEAAAPPNYLPYVAIAIVIVIVAAIAIYFLKIRKS